NLMGVHTANISSGEFSVVASPAYTIKNGEIGSPVKQAMIAGNMKDLLQKVDEVGREVKKVGNVLTPHLRIKRMKVSG
ncbi:MAG: TldD/PmbA family protein, partial [Chloroflexi bacterium]